MKKQLFVFLLLLVLLMPDGALAQTAVTITPSERKMAEAITSAQLKDYLYFVASDEMEGRDTPSRGLDLTAKFLAMMLSRWGFKPAGDDGTFFQKIVLKSEAVDASRTTLTIAGRKYSLGTDFLRILGSGSVTDAGLVYGGDGWMVKAKGIDPLAGADLKGKVVVLTGRGMPNANNLTQRPPGVTGDDLKGQRGVDWADPLTNVTAKGAVGVIIVAAPQIQNAWEQVKAFTGRGSMYPEKLRAGGGPDRIPVFLVSQIVGDAIFTGENAVQDAAYSMSKSASMSAAVTPQVKHTQNVVAVWEGSDPVLKNEMVAIGAHYDHVGINPNAQGEDKLYNGADDDGSGTVGVLAIAEALASAPKRPKRSVLFVWHTGEEKGLWGSEYFNRFPTVDIKKVTAQLNIDMIGRSRKPGDSNPRNKDLSDENSVYLIGSEVMSTTLGAVTKGTNAKYLKLNYDLRYDDPKDTNRFFFRSDHFHYAVNGIPVAFWFTGVHEDYHQPGDHPDKIDYVKMEKIARTIFLTLWELTDLAERPKVDKELPMELRQR